MDAIKDYRFSRPGDLGKQMFSELREALTFYALQNNRYAVENVVREMGSRKNMSGAKMAAEIRRGEY